MKVTLISGSPNGRKSASFRIVQDLKGYLNNGDCKIDISEILWASPKSEIKDFEEILNSDAIVITFPLYVDSIPSHLLKNLLDFEDYIVSNNIKVSKKVNVYVITNNGFFEGKQNCLVMENIKHVSNHIGFEFKGGLGIGGGGVIPNIEGLPFKNIFKKDTIRELMYMSNNIKEGQSYKTKYIELNVPAFLYKCIVHSIWRISIKSNGLKIKDLNKQLN